MANLRSRRPLSTDPPLMATLYVGVTNDMDRRPAEHRLRPTGFVRRYQVTALVYLEWTADIHAAIAREKQIKGWVRAKKVALVERASPTWRELSPGCDVTPLPQGDPSLRSG